MKREKQQERQHNHDDHRDNDDTFCPAGLNGVVRIFSDWFASM
jgi:hypothetical protein